MYLDDLKQAEQIAKEKKEIFLKVNQYQENVFVVPVFDRENSQLRTYHLHLIKNKYSIKHLLEFYPMKKLALLVTMELEKRH